MRFAFPSYEWGVIRLPLPSLAGLAEIGITSPFRRIEARRYGMMEAREWPVTWLGDKAMLDRVEMDVIHMRCVVAVITDRVAAARRRVPLAAT